MTLLPSIPTLWKRYAGPIGLSMEGRSSTRSYCVSGSIGCSSSRKASLANFQSVPEGTNPQSPLSNPQSPIPNAQLKQSTHHPILCNPPDTTHSHEVIQSNPPPSPILSYAMLCIILIVAFFSWNEMYRCLT